MADLPTPSAPGAFPATPQAGTESVNASSSYFPVNSAHLTASTLVGLVIGGPLGALALGGLSVAESTEAAALSEQQGPKQNSPIANEIGGAPVPASLLATASGRFREDAEPPSPFPAKIDTAVGVPAKASELPLIRGEKNETDFDAPPLSPENTRSVPSTVVVLDEASVPDSLKINTTSLAEPVTAPVPDRSPVSTYANEEKARDRAIAASGEDADFGKSAAAFGIGKSADPSQPLPTPPVLDDVHTVSPVTPIKVDNENIVDQDKRRHREVAVLAAGAGVGAGAYGASQLANDDQNTSRDATQAISQSKSDVASDEPTTNKFTEKLQALQQPTTATPSSAYNADSPESSIKGQDFDGKAIPAHDRFAEQRAVLHSDVQHSDSHGAAAVVGGGAIGVAGAGIVAGELYEHPAGLHPATAEQDLAHLSPPTNPATGLVASPVEQNRSEIPLSESRGTEDKQGSWGKATLAALGGGAVAGGAVAHARGKDGARDEDRLGQDFAESDDGPSPSRSYTTPSSLAAQHPVSQSQRPYDDSSDPRQREADLHHSPSAARRHAQDPAHHHDSRREAVTREQQDSNQDLHRRPSKLHRAHHPDQPREDNASPRHHDDTRDGGSNRQSLVGAAQHQDRLPLINTADDTPNAVPTEFSPHMKIAHRPDQAGHNRLHKSSHDSPIESGQSSPARSAGGRVDGSPRAAENWTPTRGPEDRGGVAGRGGSDGQAMWNDSVAHVVNDETAARGGHRPALITIDSEDRRESPRAQDGFVANSHANSSPRSDNHQRMRSTSSATPVTPSSPALSSSASRLKKDRRASQGSESATGSPNGSGTPTKKPGFFSKLIHRDKNSKRDSLDGANETR